MYNIHVFRGTSFSSRSLWVTRFESVWFWSPIFSGLINSVWLFLIETNLTDLSTLTSKKTNHPGFLDAYVQLQRGFSFTISCKISYTVVLRQVMIFWSHNNIFPFIFNNLFTFTHLISHQKNMKIIVDWLYKHQH